MSKVVVLDDNEVMLAVLGEIAAFLGHEVSTFERVEPFLQNIKEETPAYVIVDAILYNHGDGLEVIEQVRNMPGMAASHYILVTASVLILEQRSQILQRQISLLSKPCSFEDLEILLN